MSEVKVEDYVQVRAPEKDGMAVVINGMKGPDRSMADFAAATGLSTSMLSRIVNGNYSKPISTEILQKIAANRAESCPLDLEDLLEANGMMTKEDAARIQEKESRNQSILEQRRRRRDMTDIVTDELFARGIAIKKLGVLEEAKITPSKRFPDMMVCDRAITLPDEGYCQWGMFMVPIISRNDNIEKKDISILHRIIARFSVIFLQDAWEPENTKDSKMSVCFADKKYFNLFVDALQEVSLNNRFSAILVNINTRKVEKEINFPCKNFAPRESLFNIPVHKEGERNNSGVEPLSILDRFSGEDYE